MLLPDSPQVYAFTRASRQSELLVVVNVSSDPAEVGVDAAWAGTELVIGTHPGGEPFRLRPWEARVHRRRA
jgi:hypothetical protein